MNQLNSLIIEGNVVNQATINEPVDGFKVGKFSVAVNRWHKNQKGEGENEVSYFEVETFGKMAEICGKQCSKGRGIRVVGRLKQSRWQDDSGKTKSKIYVVAEHIEFKPLMNRDDLNIKESDVKAEQVSDTVTENAAETVEQKIPVEVAF